jgi:hypothetical protein
VIHLTVPHPTKDIVYEYRRKLRPVDRLYIERTDLYTEWLWGRHRVIICTKTKRAPEESYPIILSGLYGFLSDFLLRLKT